MFYQAGNQSGRNPSAPYSIFGGGSAQQQAPPGSYYPYNPNIQNLNPMNDFPTDIDVEAMPELLSCDIDQVLSHTCRRWGVEPYIVLYGLCVEPYILYQGYRQKSTLHPTRVIL